MMASIQMDASVKYPVALKEKIKCSLLELAKQKIDSDSIVVNLVVISLKVSEVLGHNQSSLHIIR